MYIHINNINNARWMLVTDIHMKTLYSHIHALTMDHGPSTLCFLWENK